MFQSPSRELTQEDPRNRTKFHTAAPCLAKHPSPLSYSCQMVRNHPPAPGAELFNYSSSFQNTYAARKSPKKKRIILFRLLGHFLKPLLNPGLPRNCFSIEQQLSDTPSFLAQSSDKHIITSLLQTLPLQTGELPPNPA